MKISTLVTFLAIVGGIVFIMASMISEGESKYDVSINKSDWENSYNYVNDVNQSLSPLIDDFNKITDTSEDSGGWFSKLVTGISAIPKAVIAVPSLVFSSIVSTKEIATGITSSLKIPGEIILIILTIITVWAVFKLVEIFQRYPL